MISVIIPIKYGDYERYVDDMLIECNTDKLVFKDVIKDNTI